MTETTHSRKRIMKITLGGRHMESDFANVKLTKQVEKPTFKSFYFLCPLVLAAKKGTGLRNVPLSIFMDVMSTC